MWCDERTDIKARTQQRSILVFTQINNFVAFKGGGKNERTFSDGAILKLGKQRTLAE